MPSPSNVESKDPSVFKRSPSPDALAAAILGFLLKRLGERLNADERRQLGWSAVTIKELAAATGVSASTIGSRRQTVAKAVDRADLDWPTLLHSSQRREAMDLKANIADYRQMMGTD